MSLNLVDVESERDSSWVCTMYIILDAANQRLPP